ncbi:dihydrolipoyl dehydrogenase [Brevibacillus humidisoli]|uniref:dihydrolipoyl dehydrogenase n=1 Tax=Brevibacillus humidisoli TaxID=2895522 RepID=UPI001E2B3448|nr:dihydrolipoyl dehydrogenase [Brevibacillus humidisoli]UFJ42355.1 dihydrolipoyl dehydrogenase [Brevibacillus humidisoli]
MKSYDIAVVGGGPGGYVAAIVAAKRGKRTALIEAGELGGTCLNRGCIPSKTLLRHAELIDEIKQAKAWGIETGELVLSLDKMMARKDQVIQRLRTGIAALLKAGKIDVYRGLGTVQPDRTIAIAGETDESIRADKVILATGSVPFVPPISGLDQVRYHTSDTIFGVTSIPTSLTIIGGGVIGVEFACIFQSLGAKVTIVEMAERIVPSEDADVAAALTKALQKKQITIMTNTRVEAAAVRDGQQILSLTHSSGEREELHSEELLVAVGRKPNLSGVGQLGLEMDGPFVQVNRQLETSMDGVYAVGDLIGGWQLAHAASAEGSVAARNAAGEQVEMDDRIVPRCIYTHPEIASVGLTEQEARKRGYQVKTSVYQHAGNGKALSLGQTEGFVKLIAEETYGEILGAVMVGPHVTEMIATPSAFIHLEGTVEEMAAMIYPHPTVSETLMEAAAKWLGRGIHS